MLKLLMELYNCKNCGNQFEVNFCNVCGQKPAHRLDVKHVLHEAVHVFTHADKGIFAFIPNILTRPGIMALEYVEGKRKKYFNPFQYLLLIVGVVVFLVVKSHMMENMLDSTPTPGLTSKQIATQKAFAGIMQKYFNVILLLFIPVFAFFSYFFFKKKKYNYAENIVLISFVQAQQNTISLITFSLFFIFPTQTMMMVTMILSFLISFFTYGLGFKQFFKVSLFNGILKAIAVTLSVIISWFLIVAIGTFLFLLIRKL